MQTSPSSQLLCIYTVYIFFQRITRFFANTFLKLHIDKIIIRDFFDEYQGHLGPLCFVQTPGLCLPTCSSVFSRSSWFFSKLQSWVMCSRVSSSSISRQPRRPPSVGVSRVDNLWALTPSKCWRAWWLLGWETKTERRRRSLGLLGVTFRPRVFISAAVWVVSQPCTA